MKKKEKNKCTQRRKIDYDASEYNMKEKEQSKS